MAGAALSVSSLGSRWAIAESASSRQSLLLCVFLRGGIDGLSVVVPHGDRAYYDARPSLAIHAPGKGDDAAIDLDGHFGLHPRLSPLAAAWKSGELAAVHAVGSPDSTRSHFEAQDNMETAVLGHRAKDGWLGRALEARPGSSTPLGTVALSGRAPLALRGYPAALSTPELARFRLRAPPRLTSRLEQGFARLYDPGRNEIERAGRDALRVSARLRALSLDDYQPDGGAKYTNPTRPLAEIAQLVKADVGLQVAWIDAGGWDTHQAQAPRLSRLLDALGSGLAAFRTDLGSRMENVVVVVMSEFGRTVRENGTGGTDHGHGTAMLLLGGPVAGGKVHGRWPGLAESERYEQRDLAVTTDFRDVLGELVDKRLGVSPERALGGYAPKRIGVLR